MPVLILVILASLAISQAATRISQVVGIDFYQYWGVPVAMRFAGHTMGPPYKNGQRYFEVLREYATSTNQPKLRAANGYWGEPDFAASPLLYTLFTPVSSDYTFALSVFQAYQMALFLGAFLLLGYLFRFDPFDLLCLVLLCFLLYRPLLSDLNVANLGCFQLIYLTGLLFLASGLERARSFVGRVALGTLLLAALAMLTLCKPNVALISALLAAHLGVRHGARVLAACALPAAAASALFLIIPCLYFRSWTVWREWYDFVYGSNAYMLVRPVTVGNYSTALLLSSWLRVDVYAVSGALMVLLVASLLAALARPEHSGPAITAARGAATRSAFRRTLADPRMTLAIAIVLTIATSPLFWLHYYLLSLIPSLWLLNTSSPPKYVSGLAAVAVVLSSGMLDVLLASLHWRDAVAASVALSWLPLWCAILLRTAASSSGGAQANL